MSKIHIINHNTQCGELILGSYDDKLCLCDWKYRKMRSRIDERITCGLNAKVVEKETLVLTETKKQLEEYFTYKRKNFDLPLLMVGTSFQKQVWNALMEVPFGKSCSYLELAKRIGNPSAVRAGAGANGANAISIIVPCHRVVGSNGKLVGYAGGLQAKKKLLLLEQSLLAFVQ